MVFKLEIDSNFIFTQIFPDFHTFWFSSIITQEFVDAHVSIQHLWYILCFLEVNKTHLHQVGSWTLEFMEKNKKIILSIFAEAIFQIQKAKIQILSTWCNTRDFCSAFHLRRLSRSKCRINLVTQPSLQYVQPSICTDHCSLPRWQGHYISSLACTLGLLVFLACGE